MNIMDDEREVVKKAYEYAKANNQMRYNKKLPDATEEYTFENQVIDANNILSMFYSDIELRVVSIIKQCKVGMDGLMIELLTRFTTHPEDGFKLPINNVFIITGMSNKEWEISLKSKVPQCFQDNIYHHGKLLTKGKLTNELSGIKNSLIIIDEIDTGDKKMQKLHKMLIKTCIFNKDYIKNNNIRFVMVSATMKNQLHELKKWNFEGIKHKAYKMSIPDNYASIKYFLDKDVYKEYYNIDSYDKAVAWIDNDIIKYYENDYRIHLIRTTENKMPYIKSAASEKDIQCFDHTSNNRIPLDELSEYFNKPLENHMILCVKGFYRRANLIPNTWKVKIGALHELCSKKSNTETEVQAFPGRMCGYWKNILDGGHKVGPIRTSIKCMKDYIEWYDDPNKQTVSRTNTMVKPNNIGIKVKEYKKVPIISDDFNGKTIYTEDECNEFRKHIRYYQISKNYINENNTVGKGNFRKLNKNYFEKEGDLYKYSHNNSTKQLWKPYEITKEHTNLCNIKDTTKLHNSRIIERRPTYTDVNGINELRYKIFYYNGVNEVEV
jgi:hypothetical protein